MRKSFTRLLMLVIMIVVTSMLSNNKGIASSSNSSPPVSGLIVMEMNAVPVPIFTSVMFDANRQNTLTVTEELAVKKCNKSFGFNTILLQPTNSVMQIVNNQITSVEPIVVMLPLMRDDRSHILKELINVRNTKNDCNLMLSQLPTMEGLATNEKVAFLPQI